MRDNTSAYKHANTRWLAAVCLTVALALLFVMIPEKVHAAGDAPKVSVAVKGEGLRVKWSKVKGAATYDVYRSYSRTKGYKRIKKGATGRSLKDVKVASGKRAYYKVLARNAAGKRLSGSKVASGVIYRVYVETGHGTGIDGTWDPGCIWNGYQEATLMIPISRATAKYLTARGVYVYTDAYSGNNRNLRWTVSRLQTLDVSVMLNIHCDCQEAPSGTMPLYRYSEQRKLAKYLNRDVHKYVNTTNRGLRKRTDLTTLNDTTSNCVACLFETGSIKADNWNLRTRYNAYGKGLARGICDYLGVKW
ncbi:MAG: hypothetical protein E7227_07320 [Clostridiales bacterium]|nr:hypothetical protein [Clostridiales bacterium]